jgi:hypothetical protein
MRPPASSWRALRRPERPQPSSLLFKEGVTTPGAAAAALTTTRLTSATAADAAPLEHQQREYAVELARSTLDLGKLARQDERTPLSRLINAVTVEQMLAHKKGDAAVVYEVREDEPVINAIELMCEKRIGSVIVRGRETQLHVGMMSRIDCMRNLVLKNQFARETPIANVMDKTVRSHRKPGLMTLTLLEC